MQFQRHSYFILLKIIMLLLAFAVGCEVSSGDNIVSSGGNNGGGSIAGAQLYVSTPSSILHFSNAETINGNVAPIHTLTGPSTQLASPRHLFIDTPNDRLYVANQGGSSVLVFDTISILNGDVSPTRIISGNATELIAPIDVALDAAKDLLYVADGTLIHVFAGASTISGNAPPVRDIQLSVAIGGVFLSATNDQLYVTEPGINAVTRLDGASLQNGTSVASGILTGPDTGLFQPRGLTLTPLNQLIVSNSATPASITLYSNASTVTGDVFPAGDITGSDTLLQSPGQIALNANNSGELFIIDSLKAGVLIFTNIANNNGNVPPARTISGPDTGIVANSVNGLALDPTR